MTQSARIAHYAPNTALPRHSHPAPRLCFVITGMFEEQNTVSRHGHLLYRPAHMPHAQRFGKTGAVCALLSPDPTWLDAARAHNIDLDSSASFASPDVARLGLALRRELAHPDAFSAFAHEAVAWECLAVLAREKAGGSDALPASLRRALEFLHANLAAPVGLVRAAHIAGVHPATLARQFRKKYGESMGCHLRRLRVERAAALIKDSQIPIAEIAIVCGFSSQAHLTTLLRRALGVTPGRLRALHRM